ncbi:HAMP domain-containing histidine kinase [Paraneptunicella aestuarii]|uniref:sensor histidine kinase n=1 Tax=Paraneptunicella aestuarii TaxID=2831148 RepID=UPI001E51023C|nr:HAMP domain-containing sensor histidine kinase [Paraneptunicella aestuarii]UAA40207.1 HAMP domain-containing histidine kinase [Paraneptunicella aestuarii]
MTDRNNRIDFSAVLASAVHDMKNSLLLLMQSIENMGEYFPVGTKQGDQIATVQYEASRLNTGLAQLLSLYRVKLDQLPLNIQEHFVEDILDELFAANQNYISHKNIKLTVEKPEDDMSWYLDADLINVMLNDVLINAMRYGNNEILIHANEKDDYFVITIEDDGPGYPDIMLKNNETNMRDFNISSGRTGLGLFFARMIAEAHINGDKKGSVHLANGGSLGGSVFTLKLP